MVPKGRGLKIGQKWPQKTNDKGHKMPHQAKSQIGLKWDISLGPKMLPANGQGPKICQNNSQMG